jgi:DNA-binding NarL/FixJ family response regulator
MYNNFNLKSSYDTIKLLLADDHELVRIGLRAIFQNHGDIELLQDAINGDDAVEFAFHFKPDVVLMDLNMPYYSGIEAATQINMKFPEIKIILIIDYVDAKIKITDLPENIKGIIIKDIQATELVNAVRKVKEGFFVFNHYILANYFNVKHYWDDNDVNNIVLEKNPICGVNA